jgi:hypothetical protein
MYRLQPIQEAMITRIGFRQTTQPKIPQLATSLTVSESGLFIQDRHPLLNTNNIYQTSENFDQWPYDPWAAPDPGEGYEENEYVKHVDKVWVSNVDDNETEPGQAPLENWSEVNNFSQYLDRVKRNAAQKTVEKIFSLKKLDRNTKTIFENIHIFDGAGNRNSMIVKTDRFVGFEIRLRKHRHLAALIKKIGTQFSNVIPGTFNLYLYHSSQQDPVSIIPLNVTEAVSFQWHNIETLTLPYVSDTQDAGGVFYLGYYEADLPVGVQAIKRDNYQWDKSPCASCGSSDYFYYEKWSAYMNFTPMIVQSSALNVDRTKFDSNFVGYTYSTNFGLNLHISCKCDLTDFIIENIDLLDDAYANVIAVDLLTAMVYTLRDAGDAKQARALAATELNRSDSEGMPKKLEHSFKALDYEMSGFNSVCLPQAQRRGVRTGSTM